MFACRVRRLVRPDERTLALLTGPFGADDPFAPRGGRPRTGL